MLTRMAGFIDVVVIGAGHSGLAMSAVLSERGIDHVVLERSEIANSWRTERWDSLRLLTPNWLSRLPGYSYTGGDPDGFMTGAEISNFLANYAKWSSAPVVSHSTVLRVTRDDVGYRVATPRGACTRRSSSALRGSRSISMLCANEGSKSWAEWWVCATGRRNFPAHCAMFARSPISNSTGCSPRSISGSTVADVRSALRLPSAWRRRWWAPIRDWRSISVKTCARCSGRQDTVLIIPGFKFQCSTTRVICGTTAESSRHRGCTCSDCPICAVVNRASSTARKTMRVKSGRMSPPIWTGVRWGGRDPASHLAARAVPFPWRPRGASNRDAEGCAAK